MIPGLESFLRRRGLEFVIATLLLMAHATLALSAAWQKSPTVDEVVHIAGGLSYWETNDYRLHPENGNLPQRWAALPLYVTGEGKYIDRTSQDWFNASAWLVGDAIYKSWGDQLDGKVIASRYMVALLSAGLGLTIFLWSRSLFGSTGGLVSLTLFAFEPNFLAHGALATSDTAASLMFLLAVGSVWRLLRGGTPGRLVCACLAVGLLTTAKHSSPILAPMIALMLVARFARGGFWVARWKSRVGWVAAGRLRILGVTLAALIIVAAAVPPTIWAMHGFRFSISSNPANLTPGMAIVRNRMIGEIGTMGEVAQFALDHRLLPEGYLHGFVYAARTVRDRSAFFRGEYGTSGWVGFFPFSFSVKTPVPTFVVLIAAAFAGVVAVTQSRRRLLKLLGGVYHTAPLWSLLAVYWFFALRAEINIGHRHILPTYAPMFILAGAAGRWLVSGPRLRGLVLAAALAALMFESVATWPNYIAYFNPIIGGPRRAYRSLVDSSLDWGQDLKGLAAWVRSNRTSNDEPIFVSYFGTAPLSAYHLDLTTLPPYPLGRPPPRITPPVLAPGWYCVSATSLQMIYGMYPGRWTPKSEGLYQQAAPVMSRLNATPPNSPERAKILAEHTQTEWDLFFSRYDNLQAARLMAYLRSREPDESIGYSILIYHLGPVELADALHGPPRQ